MAWTKPSGSGTALTTEQENTLKFFKYSQPDDLLIASKDLRIPSESLNIEELITLSEQTGFLSIVNNVTDLQFTLLDSLSLPAFGSFRPNQFYLTEAENNLVLQSDLSVPLAQNFVFNITTTEEAQTNVINLMTANTVSNVRIKVVDTVSGVAFKYLPNRLAFDSGTGGIDLVSGMAPIDLGDSQLRFSPGRQLTITVDADQTGILGNAGGIPWLSVDLQRAEFRGMVWDHQVDWRKVTGTSVGDELVIKKGEHLLIDATLAQVDLTIDFTDSDNDNFYCYIMDYEETLNINDATILLGVDTLVFDSDNKERISTLIKDGSTVRVYSHKGEFKIEGNI